MEEACQIRVNIFQVKVLTVFSNCKYFFRQSKFKVPIQRIQRSQIISFEQQLTNVIFSHCKYSLKAGHGADVTYDSVALEKHILDRFVRGKPLINTFFPGMSYRSDVIEALTFIKIRRTIKQVSKSIRIFIFCQHNFQCVSVFAFTS